MHKKCPPPSRNRAPGIFTVERLFHNYRLCFCSGFYYVAAGGYGYCGAVARCDGHALDEAAGEVIYGGFAILCGGDDDVAIGGVDARGGGGVNTLNTGCLSEVLEHDDVHPCLGRCVGYEDTFHEAICGRVVGDAAFNLNRLRFLRH